MSAISPSEKFLEGSMAFPGAMPKTALESEPSKRRRGSRWSTGCEPGVCLLWRLNVCDLTRFTWQNPNPQRDGIWPWGLWEVSRIR